MADPWTVQGAARAFPGSLGGHSSVISPVDPFKRGSRKRKIIEVCATFLNNGDPVDGSGSTVQHWTAPANAIGNLLHVVVAGVPGLIIGGGGAGIGFDLVVSPGDVLDLYVGGHPTGNITTLGGRSYGRFGGWPDGGDGAPGYADDTANEGWSGGGGGSSKLVIASTLIAQAAGGGGGAAVQAMSGYFHGGGYGGDPTGADGDGSPIFDAGRPATGSGGKGATTSAGGEYGVEVNADTEATSGTSGQGGNGGIAETGTHLLGGGGGGGGYFGGGGGGCAYTHLSINSLSAGGGGGGSSYTDGSCLSVVEDHSSSDGVITICYSKLG